MMNDSDYSKIQLRIQREIRRSEDDLVQWIQNALDPEETSYGQSGKDKLEESQFRNLIRVAETTESTEVITNFIRYQMGRDKKWGRGEKSLGKKIVKHIKEDLTQKAKDIAEVAIEKESKAERKRIENERYRKEPNVQIETDDSEISGQVAEYVDRVRQYVDTKEILITLIRLYLGYGSRHLKYLLMLHEAQAEQREETLRSKTDTPARTSTVDSPNRPNKKKR